MKVSIIGGAGAMGSAFVATAATFEEVSSIRVLDLDIERANALVERSGLKVSASAFDADRDNLVELLEETDTVVSTLGPFTRFGRMTLEAAIEAGCNYVDINDDWEPTLDVLTLDERATSAGVTALIGMGASPGVSNVLAVRAASELDEVNELITGWSVAGTSSEPGGPRPSAAMMHFIHQATGEIQVLEEGAVRRVPPLRSIAMNYPGIGDVEVYTIGHPEPVTLPRVFPDLRYSVNVMSGPEWWFANVAVHVDKVNAGEISQRDAALSLEETIARPDYVAPTKRMPTIWAWAKGLVGGEVCRVGVGLNKWPRGRMAGATAVPAAMALQMLARGEISRTGVVTPEEVVPFDLLMERLDPWYVLPEAASSLFSIELEKD